MLRALDSSAELTTSVKRELTFEGTPTGVCFAISVNKFDGCKFGELTKNFSQARELWREWILS